MDELFTQFGLSGKESSVFLELVRLGASSVSNWAKQARVNRSSMYVVLEKFKKLGLITSFTHLGVTYVQAIAMAELPAKLSDRQMEIERARNLMIKNLPLLQKLEKTHGLVPKVVFYEGKSRVETMYESMIKERVFKAFFHPGRLKELMPNYFHKIPLALRESNGRAKELLISCSEAQEYQRLYRSDRHEIKILSESVTFSSDTIITDQKIFLVGYSNTGIVATEILNEELARTQSVIFDIVWNSYE